MADFRSAVRRRTPALLAAAFLLTCGSILSRAAIQVQTLRATASLPPSMSGQFRNPLAFQRAADGGYYVFDQRGHSVYRIDPAMEHATRIVSIGAETGRLLQPTAFASEPGGTFAVADAPQQERIQVFADQGTLIGGFFPSGASRFQVVLDGLVLGGVGSLQYDGHSILISEPSTGTLITAYSPYGDLRRSFGRLRETGQTDPDLQTVLNTGLPLFNPQGGYDFVFQTGRPLFRRYDRDGHLLFERHIEGREIDDLIARLPTAWPKRPPGSHEFPIAHPIVRTAAIDRQGNLWVALVVPYIYVYDADGDKVRVVQLRTAEGPLAATSLFFDPQGRLLVTPGCFVFTP
ncbi:MAG TPA: hypothetical protein VND92_02515 [Vicinamibacterales bacterium]|nr:hypothetical protein [Vicinamibacterales bacterium]